MDPDRGRSAPADEAATTREARSQMAGIFLFGLLLLGVWEAYHHFVALTPTPSWDGFAYMENARNWREGTPLLEPFRPPLLSWIIDVVWLVTGESTQGLRMLNAVFSMAAGVVLYVVIRRHKGDYFALGVVGLVWLQTTAFVYSTQLYTEGLAALCLAGALYFLESRKPSDWIWAGVCLGLAFGARYPALVSGLCLFGAMVLVRRDWRAVRNALLGLLPTMGAIIVLMILKTGTFAMSLPKDRHFTLQLSSYYVVHALDIWGLIVFLVPLALLLPSTWRRSEHLPYLAWAFGSLVFWSANALNQQYRFTINFSPAIYFVALLFVEWVAHRALGRRAPLARPVAA
jgi:hypothetical protein